MIEHQPPARHRPSAPRAASRPPISWPAAVGFGALGLLWPLVRMLRFDELVGELGAALLVFAVVGTAWIMGAGFGRVPRPVPTLTLAGVLFGLLFAVSSLLLGEWPDYGIGPAVIALVIEVGRAAGLGALAGLAASGIHRMRA